MIAPINDLLFRLGGIASVSSLREDMSDTGANYKQQRNIILVNVRFSVVDSSVVEGVVR